MKTYKEWNVSKLPLSQFLSIGDEVCEDIAEYFLCCLPPVTWKNNIIQMGEAYSHTSNGLPTYLTIEKSGGSWVYTGIKTTPKHWAQTPTVL